jgi:hypothetical protein
MAKVYRGFSDLGGGNVLYAIKAATLTGGLESVSRASAVEADSVGSYPVYTRVS